MPTKKRQATQQEMHGPAKLMIPRNDFRKNLEKRISIGKDTLLPIEVNSQEGLDELNHEYSKWSNWNEEYLKVSFNYRDNEYAEAYSRWGVISMTMDSNLWREIQDKKDDINKKIKKLEVLLDKVDLIQEVENLEIKEEKNSISLLLDIMNGFNRCAQEMRYRYNDRETITIKDEYDVQDLLGSILKIFFKDVRSEEYSPSSAGGNSRIDFVLPEENIIIEVKNATERTKDKELGEQIAIDIARYEKHPSYKILVVFIYDKGDNIRNKRGLIQDLERQSKNGKKVIVIINPE